MYFYVGVCVCVCARMRVCVCVYVSTRMLDSRSCPPVFFGSCLPCVLRAGLFTEALPVFGSSA